MSLLIAVPIHGYGETPFWLSMMNLQVDLYEAEIKHDFLIITNESLVQRARNNIVTSFLETEYQKLMFIDSDIEFTSEDVQKLWNLQTEVAVGCYSMKRPDQPVTAWKNGALVNINMLSEPTEIDYAGTGFMMIARSVFSSFQEAYPDRWHYEGAPTDNVFDQRKSFLYFDPRKSGDWYASEDYAFSLDWRNLGGKIILDPSIKLKHWGRFGYG